jgi:hypothetical protein
MTTNDVRTDRSLQELSILLEEHENAIRELRTVDAAAKSTVSIAVLRSELRACIPAPSPKSEGFAPVLRRLRGWVTRLFRSTTPTGMRLSVQRSEAALLAAYARVCEQTLPVCVSSMLLRHFRMLKGATYASPMHAARPSMAPAPLVLPAGLSVSPQVVVAQTAAAMLRIKRDIAVGSGA